MSDVLKRINKLARTARDEMLPMAIDPTPVILRLRAAQATGETAIPLNIFAGIGAFSAIAAAVTLFFAFNVWSDINDPVSGLFELFDFID